MTTLAAIPVHPDQLDLLDQITDVESPIGKLHALDFQAACVAVGRANDGWVNPNAVSALLHETFGEINPRWYSGMWTSGCGKKNGFMITHRSFCVPIAPKYSKGNSNKYLPMRRLRGAL